MCLSCRLYKQCVPTTNQDATTHESFDRLKVKKYYVHTISNTIFDKSMCYFNKITNIVSSIGKFVLVSFGEFLRH